MQGRGGDEQEEEEEGDEKEEHEESKQEGEQKGGIRGSRASKVPNVLVTAMSLILNNRCRGTNLSSSCLGCSCQPLPPIASSSTLPTK